MTEAYNEVLKKRLPEYGIELVEVERVCEGGVPISASNVRKLIEEGNISALSRLVPKTTVDYITENDLI